MKTTRRTVLLALTDAHHGFFRGVARYAREHHWHLVADMIYTARVPLGWQGDGIISFIGYRDDLAEFVLSAPMPKVEISLVRADLNLPRVEADNDMIGTLAAQHFRERGFRHFVWAPLINDIVNAERYAGFANRLAKEGMICHLLPPAYTLEEKTGSQNWVARRKTLVQELKRLPKPLAVFAYNDCVAADIIDACEKGGLLVPEAVAVMGVDNDPILCECVSVPLSSVCHDLEGMAYEAAALLDRLMHGRKAPKEILRIPPKGVVTRRSTDILAVENLQVARALRYIHDQYSNPLLGVGDIVASTRISRRPLEKAFRQEVNRSINEEVVRIRLEKVEDLLTTTSFTVKQIAATTGFTRPNHLFRIFRATTGLSPLEYRKKHATKGPTRATR
jgi:LacI family transcriptional regulator